MIVIIRLATIGRLNVYTDNCWHPYWSRCLVWLWLPAAAEILTPNKLSAGTYPEQISEGAWILENFPLLLGIFKNIFMLL